MRRSLHRLIYVLRTMSWLCDPRRLWKSPAYPIDRPIFLLGTQGGGLTLLSRMLRRHPDVISAAGNHRYWSSADELQNVYGPILPAELTGLRYKAPFDAELPAPRSWTYAVRDLYPQYRKRAADATPRLAQTLTGVIRFAARRHASNRHQFRFLDKSQTFTVRVGLIHALLGEANPRFVLVPRDPYVSVLRAAEGKAADMKRLAEKMPLAERIQICAEHYGNSMRAVFEDCDELHLELHNIQFERLLRQPESSLRAVCEFVGLDFRDDMLPSAEHRLPLGSRFLDRWYPIRTSVNEPYEERLDAVVVDAVNHHCGDIIPRLGYEVRRSTPVLTQSAA